MNSNISTLISIVIPVYNAQKYLRQCLDSVLASTHRNLEKILIDDGSSDSSGYICDEYAATDNRIIVLHQENRGVSSARNSGISIATGTYIGFVDADDLITATMYDHLLRAIHEADADIAACDYTREVALLSNLRRDDKPHVYTVNGINDCLALITMSPFGRISSTDCVLCNKIYLRKNIIPLDEHLPFSEDMLFNFKYINEHPKIAVIKEAMYYYRENTSSATHAPTISKYIYEAKVWRYLADNAHGLTVEMNRHLIGASAYKEHRAAWIVFRSGEENHYAGYIAEIRKNITQNFKDLITHPWTNLKLKIPVLLFRYCYPLWKVLAKLHRK